MEKHFFLSLLALGGFCLEVRADESNAGSFTANEECITSATQEDIKLEKGKSYKVIESDACTSGRIKIEVEGPTQRQRWVPRSCGTLQNATPSKSSPTASKTAKASYPASGKNEQISYDLCRKAGGADSHVLALSWHPAFCETDAGRDKRECQTDNPEAFPNTHFSLHGLWPNQSECGKDYSYCGRVSSRPSEDLCAYPPVNLGFQTISDLTEVMPSVRAGTCLERHEWHKHGTCEKGLSADAYFKKASILTFSFNNTPIRDFMKDRMGNTVREQELFKKVEQVYGKGSSKKMELVCDMGNLVELRIQLPKDLDGQLDQLITKAKGFANPRSNCGGTFRIDRPGINH